MNTHVLPNKNRPMNRGGQILVTDLSEVEEVVVVDSDRALFLHRYPWWLPVFRYRDLIFYDD